MEIGMIGLGRMGANMVRRLMRSGHRCVVYDVNADTVAALAKEGAVPATSREELVSLLSAPRAVWMMLPAAIVDAEIDALSPLLSRGDALIDGGNSHYQDGVRRAKALAERGIVSLDVGTSGGVWGLERGYCLMIGGDKASVNRLDPIFAALAPGYEAAPATVGRTQSGTADRGYLHCGEAGAGHFVKMVHNGIEYGLMAAYAEGFNILKHADAGLHQGEADAETTPLRQPEMFRYTLDTAEIAELWRRGSVVGSWLLDLTAQALHETPDLSGFAGRVSDSGEGRWTLEAAIEEGVPAPVLSAALFARFSSRGASGFGDQLLSAMRFQFGGHHEKPAGGKS
ncbi:MAG: phosphogluconate dehydrogenase (NAD(+)-dependent, decarboxylating) [Gemmatimonadota bacterium]